MDFQFACLILKEREFEKVLAKMYALCYDKKEHMFCMYPFLSDYRRPDSYPESAGSGLDGLF